MDGKQRDDHKIWYRLPPTVGSKGTKTNTAIFQQLMLPMHATAKAGDKEGGNTEYSKTFKAFSLLNIHP